MSRFNSEIKVLEQQLKKYQKELQQLHDENASLKQREEGLCRSLVTLQVRDMSPALHNVMSESYRILTHLQQLALCRAEAALSQPHCPAAAIKPCSCLSAAVVCCAGAL